MEKKKVVIDLNGHTITSPSSESITFKNNDPDTVLVFEDSSADKSGKVINTFTDNVASNDGGICVWARRGDVEINGGTFQNTSILESTVYVGTTTAKLNGANPVMTINDGKFINNAEGEYNWKKGWKPITLNVINNMTPEAMQVKGGEFYSQDPALGDDNLGGTFVADGYKSVEIDGGFKVVKDDEE